MKVEDEVKVEIEDLVEKAKNGDKDAFSKLIGSLQNYLYEFACLRLDNHEDAKDAVQEAITSAYFNIHKLKDNKLFKTWITRILINKCNKIYASHKRKSDLTEKIITSDRTASYFEDNLDFDTMIDSLDEKEKTIFRLHYEDGLSVKRIANRLNMNENTIKTILSRGRNKIKKVYKPATILMVILCVLVGASVIAVSIINYIQSLFNLDSMGKDNSGVMNAIEHLEWFQEVDVGTIDFGNGCKIAPYYLLMDEMNLYMVLDITSEEDISKVTDVSFPDLKIIDESGNVICNQSDLLGNQYSKIISTRLIENDKSHIKILLYMYTDNFPASKVLDISLSKIEFLSKSFFGNRNYFDISGNANFKIELSDKFINRSYTTYNSKSPEIEKAIITETGFYAMVKSDNLLSHSTNKISLIDENNNSYNCYFNNLAYNNSSYGLEYLITSEFNNKEISKIKLVIDDIEYELIKN